MTFDRIGGHKKRSAYAADQILQAIRNGEYSPGDRLPAERAIADEMGVSRNSVREAISALQIGGILEAKVGSGTYVRHQASPAIDIEEALGKASKTSEDLVQIWEARREIEATLARLAVRRADSENIAEIDARLQEMWAAAERGEPEAYLTANERFHLAVAQSADNLPLLNALQSLQRFTNNELLVDINLAYIEGSMDKSLHEHKAIAASIRDRDKEQAVRAVHAHFKGLLEYFQSQYPERRGT